MFTGCVAAVIGMRILITRRMALGQRLQIEGCAGAIQSRRQSVAELRAESMSANAPEPAPEPNERRPVWELVVEDMQERNKIGTKRYGTPLQAFNGRDPIVDAYQEVLDLAVYLRQAIEERCARAIQSGR